MANSFRDRDRSRQSSIGDEPTSALSTVVDDDVEALREAVAEQGWTLDSIAAAMGREASYRSHISRVLNGERPFTVEFREALPWDLRGAYYARMAERHNYVAIKPATDAAEAERLALRSSLFYMRQGSAPQLPAKASGQLKVDLPIAARKVAAR